MKLHEQTQRFILLLIFYLFGPILTLGIVGGIVLRKLPSNAQRWERSLAQQTGLHWTIQAVEYRSPGLVRLHKVEIFDDTARHSVFQTPQIDVRFVTDKKREHVFPGIQAVSETHTGLTKWLADTLPLFLASEQFWQITIPQASILDFGNYSSEGSALLVQTMLRKVATRLETLSEVPVQFVVEQIYVISEQSLQRIGENHEDKVDTFRFVQGNIYRTASEIRSDWSFQIKNVSETEVLHLSFALPHDSMTITFRTGSQPVPCDLATVFYASFKHFSGGSFLGEFMLSTQNNSQTIRLNNVIFRDVPLAPLVRSYTDFLVMGTITDLRFKEATFGTDGFDVAGSLRVQNGAIERTLLHRCIDHFDLTVQPDDILDLPGKLIPFSESVVLFHLQPGGIDFWADHEWGNALMIQAPETVGAFPKMVLRFPPNRRAVTPFELMSIFAPDGAPVVPLTHGSQVLMPYMPTR
jgi:hypothetical protein